MKNLLLFTSILCLTYSCQPNYDKGSPEHIAEVSAALNDDALIHADGDYNNWLLHGRTYKEQRFSPLDQINKENIGELGLAWTLNLGSRKGIEATPIVVDGIMYVTSEWSKIHAIDTRNGNLIWTYDPKVNRDISSYICCDAVNRGVAVYRGDVYAGTLDGRLVSVDASTGVLNWEVTTIPEDQSYTITGAPRVFDGKVIIGNGGAEFYSRGYVTAYDARSGNLEWRFYTVPGNPSEPFENPILEEAAKTWTGEWWSMGGGGTVWDAIAYDPELKLIYLGVGNGAPWDRNERSPDGGDNWFLSSIVALHADDGTYAWHYQTTPGDTWDYTSTQHMILAELEIDGAVRNVIMQAPKNGFFFVLDRETGEFISAEAYTFQNWAVKIDENGRPVEEDYARYTAESNVVISPGPYGGHNWQPMSYSPVTGLVYLPSHMMSTPFSGVAGYKYNEADGSMASGVNANVSVATKLYKPTIADPEAPDPMKPFGRLIAYDPVKQEEVWAVEQISHWNGGVLSTASNLVFQGNAQGIFSAYDAESGDLLWQKDVRGGVIAPPVSYMVDGIQYVSVAVGWGGATGIGSKFTNHLYPGTIYTFSLGGSAQYPDKNDSPPPSFTGLDPTVSPVEIGQGYNTFLEYCAGCHVLGMGGGVVPDLTMSSDQVLNSYREIVLGGQLLEHGMPDFGEILDEENLELIRQYILYTAKSFRDGMDPLEYMTNLAQLQYLADTTPDLMD